MGHAKEHVGKKSLGVARKFKVAMSLSVGDAPRPVEVGLPFDRKPPPFCITRPGFRQRVEMNGNRSGFSEF